MFKLTEAHRKALKTIAENHGSVVANLQKASIPADMVWVNGSTANTLNRHGLIVQVSTGRQLVHTYRSGNEIAYDITAWELTEAGKAAI